MYIYIYIYICTAVQASQLRQATAAWAVSRNSLDPSAASF